MNIIIYSKDNCPNCLKVKNALNKFRPKILILDKDISREDFLKKFPNVKQVPQVTIDDQYIGGYEDTKKWLAFNTPGEDF